MSHLPAWGLRLLSSGYYGERREGVGPGVVPTAHPESPASESRRFSRVSKLPQELTESGRLVSIFTFPLCHPLSPTQHICSFREEAALTWKTVTGAGRGISIYNISCSKPATLICWAGTVGLFGWREASENYPHENEKFQKEWQALARGSSTDPLVLKECNCSFQEAPPCL